MKLFTCTNFVGFWPVGTAAVMLAKNENEARSLLLSELKERGLLDKQENVRLEIKHIKMSVANCVILRDGDY